MMRSRIVIVIKVTASLLGTWFVVRLYKHILNAYEQAGNYMYLEYAWFFQLLLNIGGYATVLLPGFILYKYLDKSNYFDKIGNSTHLSRILYACFGEPTERLPDSIKPTKVDETPAREGLELALCFTGLMGAYLVWGLLQEKIMTQSYQMADGTLIKFDDSQFLVFINRLLAFAVALGRLLCTQQPLVAAPLYKFSFCSLTNIVSAWCQYEALKYVSFPTQVLSKSCKVIPVMMMGKLISRTKYELYEYVTAIMISVGMVLFMFGSHDDNAVSTITTMSGVTLLALYMVCDSFTSSWQGALFTNYNCSSLQMLCGVNLFSCVLTAASLVHHSNTQHSLRLLQHPVFALDVLLLSASSAAGQLLIYRTIARFGAVVFTIIMTLRQAGWILNLNAVYGYRIPNGGGTGLLLTLTSAILHFFCFARRPAKLLHKAAVSILLSCVVYGHRVSAGGGAGVALVFAAALLRVYCRRRLRARSARV